MPFDDSNIRKLVRYQLEKKIHFSRYKPLSNECKQLILAILEPDIKLRITIFQIKSSDWFKGKICSPVNDSLSIPKIFNPMQEIMKTTINENYQLGLINQKNTFEPLLTTASPPKD